jgi:hypothetical protein
MLARGFSFDALVLSLLSFSYFYLYLLFSSPSLYPLRHALSPGGHLAFPSRPSSSRFVA